MENIEMLAQQWQAAKEAESRANAERIEIELKLIKMVGVRDEGTTTHDGGHFKVKTVGKLTRSVDDKALSNDWMALSPEIQNCFKWKPSLDLKSFRALESLRDDLAPIANKYLTVKAAKPSVSVEFNNGN